MNRPSLSILALSLAFLTACSTPRQSSPSGPAGRTLSLAEGPLHARFEVPPGWKVISSKDEPLDWAYAADAPSGKFSLGVTLSKNARPMTILESYQAYLGTIWNLYDPKVRMVRDASYSLKGGRSVPSYRYFSSYWGERIVVIIPEGQYSTMFEFSNPDGKTIEGHHAEIQQILGTYSSRAK